MCVAECKIIVWGQKLTCESDRTQLFMLYSAHMLGEGLGSEAKHIEMISIHSDGAHILMQTLIVRSTLS